MRVWTWVRKEWGDHRAVLLGMVIAIPLLTGLAFWGLGNALRGATSETVAGIFALGLLILLWFGVAADLVATDVRRGTLSSVRRTPRGLGAAWAGKLAFLVLAVTGLAAWTALTLQGAWAVFVGDNGMLEPGPGLDPHFWTTVAMGAPLLSWPLLTGTWIGRSGAAGLGGALVLAATAAPVWLWWRAHPYVLPIDRIEAVQWIAVAVGASGFVLATLSFLIGHRHRGRAWRPFLVGGSGLAVLMAGGLAWGAWQVQRWTHLEPTDPDLSIYAARVAAGEQKLWVSVHRGAPWLGGHAMVSKHEKDRAGTPVQTWIVDLSTRAVTRIEGGDEAVISTPNRLYRSYWNPGFESLDPAVALWTYAWELEDTLAARKGRSIDRIKWWDAATGERVATLAPEVRNAATDALMQRYLRESTPHRDADGKRVWLRNGVFEREGEERPVAERAYRQDPEAEKAVVPGGWLSARLEPDRRGRPGDVRVAMVDVEGAETFAVVPRGMYPFPPTVLSTTHWLTRAFDLNDRRKLVHDKRVVRSFLDPDVGTRVDWDVRATVVGIDQVLLTGADPAEPALVLRDPRTGAEQVLQWVGPTPERVDGVFVHGRRSDGRVLARLSLLRPDNRSTSRFAVVDLHRATATLVGGEAAGGHVGSNPIALLEDGSVVVVEGDATRGYRGQRGKRVVRLGPGPDKRTVLFPFAD